MFRQRTAVGCPLNSERTFTSGDRIDVIAGARMNVIGTSCISSNVPRVTKLPSWRPYALRLTATGSEPNHFSGLVSSRRPGSSIFSARRISPAHVAYTGSPPSIFALSGSKSPRSFSSFPCTVDSPPGSARRSMPRSRSDRCRISNVSAPSARQCAAISANAP